MVDQVIEIGHEQWCDFIDALHDIATKIDVVATQIESVEFTLRKAHGIPFGEEY